MTTEETEDEANFRRTSWLVRHMTGNTSRVPVSVVWRNEPILQLDVEVASIVRQLKTLIASATGIPEDEQLLIYAEHVLRNDLLTLEAVGLKAGHVIYFVAPWWRPSDAPDAAPDQFDLAKSFRALGDVPKGMLVGLDISGDAPLIAPSPSRGPGQCKAARQRHRLRGPDSADASEQAPLPAPPANQHVRPPPPRHAGADALSPVERNRNCEGHELLRRGYELLFGMLGGDGARGDTDNSRPQAQPALSRSAWPWVST